jgi:hypothetical protein
LRPCRESIRNWDSNSKEDRRGTFPEGIPYIVSDKIEFKVQIEFKGAFPLGGTYRVLEKKKWLHLITVLLDLYSYSKPWPPPL